jgi:hypothetical protein
MAGFAHQVNDCPVVFPLLNIAKRQGDDLRPSQSTAEGERDNCGVALLAKCLGGGSREELSAGCCAQPIANPTSELRYALHPTDAGDQFGLSNPVSAAS